MSSANGVSTSEIIDLVEDDDQKQEEEKTLYTIKDKTIENFSKVKHFFLIDKQKARFVFSFLDQQEGLGLIVEATKCTNAMPSGTSRNLYSAHPAFGKVIDKHSEKILSIISKVLKKQQIKGNIQR